MAAAAPEAGPNSHQPGPAGHLKPRPPLSHRMPEEVLFEDERGQDRGEIAAYLRSIADKLDAGGAITIAAGDRSVTVDPPARPTFEVKVERETAAGAETGELAIELEIEWDEDGSGAQGSGGSLRVE